MILHTVTNRYHMVISSRTILSLIFLGMTSFLYSKEEKPNTHQNTEHPSPWMKPRELSSFQSLLQHSPFSLATAEESSPLSERYILTGIITLDGEEQVFVLDRNDQSRELLTKKPNKKAMSLVSIAKETDPNKLKATIRVNAETGVITSQEVATNNPSIGPQRFPGPGGPNVGGRQQKNMFHPPATPYYPGQAIPNPQHSPGAIPNPNNPANHRIITRPPIPGQPVPPSQAPNFVQ